MNSSFKELYQYIFYDLADPRSKDLPIFGDPISFFLVYSVLIIFFGFLLPLILKTRNFEKIKVATNRFTLFYAILVQMVMTNPFLYYIYTFHFKKVYKSWNLPKPDESGAVDCICLFLFFRMINLAEITTIVLNPRKNAKLYFIIYHHSLFPLMIWTCLRYFPTTFVSFFGFINLLTFTAFCCYKPLSSHFKFLTTKKIQKNYVIYLQV
jgi:GNS1/SUR4 family